MVCFLLSFLLFTGTICCHFFGSFVALPALARARGFNSIDKDVDSLLRPASVFFFLSFVILTNLLMFGIMGIRAGSLAHHESTTLVCTSLTVSFTGLKLTRASHPRLLAENFSHGCVIGCLNVCGCAVCSTMRDAGTSTREIVTSDDSAARIVGFAGSGCTRPGPGCFKGTRNVGIVCLRLRSVRAFLVGCRLRNRRMAPFLGSLVRRRGAACFSGFFRRATRKGATSTRFVLRGSLCKLPRNSTFAAGNVGACGTTPTVLGSGNCASTIFRNGSKDF